MSDSLTPLSAQLARIILPINIVLGIVGNALNIVVLTRASLYKYASTHFFLAMAINNLFGSAFVSLNDLLAIGYKININVISQGSCKLVRYFSDLSALLSFYFIVLASIDRYHASSLEASRRRLSNVRTARWLIVMICIGFALLYINTLVLIDLDKNDGRGCSIRTRNIYYQLYPILQVLIYAVLAPGLMIVFGLLTIYNTKKIRVNSTRLNSRRHRTERQLSAMLLVQVTIHLALTLPVSVFYLLLVFLPPRFLTGQFSFMLLMARYLCEFSYSTPFFLYIVSGHTFQRELFKFFKRLLRRASNNQIQPITTENAVPWHWPARLQFVTIGKTTCRREMCSEWEWSLLESFLSSHFLFLCSEWEK